MKKFEAYFKNHVSRLDDEVETIEAEDMSQAEEKARFMAKCYGNTVSVQYVREINPTPIVPKKTKKK